MPSRHTGYAGGRGEIYVYIIRVDLTKYEMTIRMTKDLINAAGKYLARGEI